MRTSAHRYLAVAIVLAAMLRPGLEFVLKAVIDRERPDISPLGEFAGPSHPSGHPLAAAALWGLVAASLLWACLYLMVVQSWFDRFHRDRDCRHSQHETQVGATADDVSESGRREPRRS